MLFYGKSALFLFYTFLKKFLYNVLDSRSVDSCPVGDWHSQLPHQVPVEVAVQTLQARSDPPTPHTHHGPPSGGSSS